VSRRTDGSKTQFSATYLWRTKTELDWHLVHSCMYRYGTGWCSAQHFLTHCELHTWILSCRLHIKIHVGSVGQICSREVKWNYHTDTDKRMKKWKDVEVSGCGLFLYADRTIAWWSRETSSECPVSGPACNWNLLNTK